MSIYQSSTSNLSDHPSLNFIPSLHSYSVKYYLYRNKAVVTCSRGLPITVFLNDNFQCMISNRSNSLQSKSLNARTANRKRSGTPRWCFIIFHLEQYRQAASLTWHHLSVDNPVCISLLVPLCTNTNQQTWAYMLLTLSAYSEPG